MESNKEYILPFKAEDVADRLRRVDDIPTKVSQLENDKEYITQDDIPATSIVTEETVAGWGFTKNTGDYSKPSSGIPMSDLDSSVQASLAKADSALQEHQDISGKQDAITDLDDIRRGAELGKTALQSIPAEYAKKADIDAAIASAITLTLNTEV